MSSIFSTFLAKVMFFPLFFTFNSQKLTFCEKNSECNVGFTCTKHFSYENNICKTNNNEVLTKLTPFLIEGYGNELKMDENMIKMLSAISWRESHNKWWEHHYIPSDIRGTRRAKRRLNYKKLPDSKYQTYGLFGLNSVIFLTYLNYSIPPEILMHPFFSIKAYSNAADKAYYKLKKGVVCKGKKYYGRLKNKPTLSDIHNAVSGGKICPRQRTNKHEKWLHKNIPFIYVTHYKPIKLEDGA